MITITKLIRAVSSAMRATSHSSFLLEQDRTRCPWFYLCLSYLWQRFKVESPYPLSSFRRWCWKFTSLASRKTFQLYFLRDSFQTALLNELHSKIGDSFKKLKASIYQDHKNGFYVRAMPNKCNPSQVIKYIGRYLGRPVIATSRIDSYDSEFITFHYNRHEDEKLVIETIPVLDFIARLTQHIPEKHFKMIRYYGIYSRHRKFNNFLHRAISRENIKYFFPLIDGENLPFFLWI